MTVFKSVALKLNVDVTAKTYTVENELVSADGEVFTASYMYEANGDKMLAIGAAY